MGAAAGPQGYPQALGYDPGRDDLPESPEEEHRKQVGKRVDLPAEAYTAVSSPRLYPVRIMMMYTNILTKISARSRTSFCEASRTRQVW